MNDMDRTLLFSKYGNAVYLARHYQREAEILLGQMEALANEDAEHDTAIQKPEPSFSMAEVQETVDAIEFEPASIFDLAAHIPISNYRCCATPFLAESASDPALQISNNLRQSTYRMKLTRDIQSRIAKQLGLSRSHVSMVANGHRESLHVKEALAKEYARVDAELASKTRGKNA